MAQSTIQLSSTSMRLVLQAIIGSLRPSASFECARCGSSITAQRMDGTSGSVSIVVTHGRTLNSSRSKHVAALTLGGSVSISCECELSEPAASADSGKLVGISFIPESFDANDRNWLHTIELIDAELRAVVQRQPYGPAVIASMMLAHCIVAGELDRTDLAPGTRALAERVYKSTLRFLEAHLGKHGCSIQLERIQ